jgi:hypothetical protein
MKGLFAVMLGLALVSCGSSSNNNTGGGDPKALCMQGTTALCNKIYDCDEAAPLRTFFGATKADCVSMLNASNCTSATGCDTGQTYHADQAQACLNAFNALACSQLTDPNAAAPPSCDMVCTSP